MLAWLAAGFVGPYMVAWLWLALLGKWPVRSGGLLAAWCVPVALAPGLIPADCRLLRFLAAISAVVVAVKMFDLWLDARRGAVVSWREGAAFLAHPFIHVRRRLAAERQPSRRASVHELLWGAFGCALAVGLLRALFRVEWDAWPFALEHAGKVTVFLAAIICGLAAATALWRLAGGAARDYMDNPLAARTPADFWRRYNRNMQQFFWEDVFKPVGGLRFPIRTTLLVFAVSAVIHEYVFGIAIGRVQGYQTAFFLLQGAAVAWTARRQPRGWHAVAWTLGTLTFNLTTSVLFFASLHAVVPFYSHGLPPWLP